MSGLPVILALPYLLDATFPTPAAALLIPAYCPAKKLYSFLCDIIRQRSGIIVVVVDDGSGPEYESIFQECALLPEVTILCHERNLGKGAALKTGIHYLGEQFPQLVGIVTADADGQHLADDVLRVMEMSLANPDRLVLGVRTLNPSVPLRSRFGNSLTRWVVGLLLGQTLTDTQTGLRGIPLKLARHLETIRAQKYEFELEMLIVAKHHGYSVIEQPIQTVYLDGNASSHFNPLLDSMRIYFVLLRFSALSLLTALLDNVVFLSVYSLTKHIALSQIVGRSVAVLFNYRTVRRAVFLSGESHRVLFPRYLLLVFVSGLASYSLIRILHHLTGIPVFTAKIAAETLLFFVNFIVQRDFIFKRKAPVQE